MPVIRTDVRETHRVPELMEVSLQVQRIGDTAGQRIVEGDGAGYVVPDEQRQAVSVPVAVTAPTAADPQLRPVDEDPPGAPLAGNPVLGNGLLANLALESFLVVLAAGICFDRPRRGIALF